MMDYPDKHTPGPWQLHEVTNSRGKVTRYRIYSGHDYGQHTDVAREPQEADARLIAAAPELLEALEWITDIADKNFEQDTALRSRGARTLKRIAEKAGAAIAKARGE
jgi:hypothetical protein